MIKELMLKGAICIPSHTSALDTNSLLVYSDLKELIEKAYHQGYETGREETLNENYAAGFGAGFDSVMNRLRGVIV